MNNIEKKKRGGQPGNKNAVGHGAPKGNKNAAGHGAPYGNCNAMQHGKYSIYRPENRRELYLAALNYMDRNHIPITRDNMLRCASILSGLRESRKPEDDYSSLMKDVFKMLLEPDEIFKAFSALGIKPSRSEKSRQ